MKSEVGAGLDQGRRFLFKAAGVSALVAAAGPVGAQATRRPLLIEGKKTLFQRVLSRPGAMLSQQPGVRGNSPLDPFTVFFVYERRIVGNEPWLLVGASSDGKTDGFIEEAASAPWRHMITLSFSVAANRDRVLFFKNREAVLGLLNAPDRVSRGRQLAEQVRTSAVTPASALVAAEPEQFVDIQRRFYLLPVLEAHNQLLSSGHRTRVVRVASVNQTDLDPRPAPTNNPAAVSRFTNAVVFVIDATRSMQPYIERVRGAVKELLTQAQSASLVDRMAFGLFAYQDDPAKTRGMDYLTAMFVDPRRKLSAEQFIEATQNLKATTFSTRAFAEDTYAGIDHALRSVKWDDFGGRHLVLVTDASAREGNSPLASTRLATQQVVNLAREHRVAIHTLHLKTAEGRADHPLAESQYRRLSEFPGVGSLYYPVEAGDPAVFQTEVSRMMSMLLDQVRTPAALAASPSSDAPQSADSAQRRIQSLGRAMMLAYLGREQGVTPPPMYEAWASDRDLRNLEVASFVVRVLLTKNQLSDLQATVSELAGAYEKSQVDPENFFNQLRSAALAMGRDPSRLARGRVRNLEEAGLMGEYLQGLPYQSKLMSMDLDTWVNMSVGQAQAMIDELNSKVETYKRYHDDVDKWVKLNPKASDGDRVFPVPLDDLP